MNIPIFNGRLFNALHAEAQAQAGARQQYLRDLQNRIVRDVRKAWLNANSGYQRLALTQQLLDQANQALDLAQQRYKLGLSSIIELSQAATKSHASPNLTSQRQIRLRRATFRAELSSGIVAVEVRAHPQVCKVRSD